MRSPSGPSTGSQCSCGFSWGSPTFPLSSSLCLRSSSREPRGCRKTPWNASQRKTWVSLFVKWCVHIWGDFHSIAEESRRKLIRIQLFTPWKLRSLQWKCDEVQVWTAFSANKRESTLFYRVSCWSNEEKNFLAKMARLWILRICDRKFTLYLFKWFRSRKEN